MRKLFRETDGVVDVTGTLRPTRPKRVSRWTRRRPAERHQRRHDCRDLRLALAGSGADILHLPTEKEDLNIVLSSRAQRAPRPKTCWR